MLRSRLLALAALTTLTACPLTPTNPFDPDTPAAQQAKASLEGRIVLVHDVDAATLQRELEAVRIGLRDGAGRPVARDGGLLRVTLEDVDGGDGGRFFIGDLLPDTYELVVENLPGFIAPPLPAVRLPPGFKADVGELVFTFDEGGAGAGSINGEVLLANGGAAQRTVTLYKKRANGVLSVGSVVGDGAFTFDGLGLGSYAVVAEADGYTTDTRLDVDIAAGDGAQTSFSFAAENALTLHPISAVLAVQQTPTVRVDDGRTFVNGDDVSLALLAFGGVTGMRISTRADFLDGDGGAALPFIPFNALQTLPLPAVEGEITLFAQFEARGVGFAFESDTFATTIVRDVSAPRVVDATILGAVRGDDGVFLAPTSALALRIDAVDDVSAVDGLGIALGDAPPADVEDVTAPSGLVRFERPLNAAGDGAVSAFIVVSDKAGNRAEPVALPLVVDTSAPDVALVVANAPGGTLSSRVARLAFDESASVTDLPVAVQVRVVGDAFSLPIPYADVVAAGGADVVVSEARGAHGDEIALEARVIDRIGNEVTLAADVTLALTSTITGAVVAEGVPLVTPNAGGAVISVRDASGALVGQQTLPSPASSTLFTIPGVPEGAGYTLDVALAGYRTATRAGITSPTPPADGSGALVDVGAIELALARGNIEGSAVLGDVAGGAGHGGTTLTLALVSSEGRVYVDATESDDAGNYTFADVPVTRSGESLRIEATHDGYAVAAVDVAAVVADAVAAAPAIALSRNRGDFDICPASGTCEPVQFVNTDSVRVRLRDPTDVVTLHVSVAGAPAVALPLAPDNATSVSIAGLADGSVELSVQTEKSDGSFSEALAASVVRDTVAPASVSVARVASASARDARFTRDQFVDVTLTADAGAGVVAPLALPRFIVADTAPGTIPEVAGCTQSAASPCRLALPGAAVDNVPERLHRVFASSCDAAGNCGSVVSTFVIHDRTPPSAAHGTSLSASAPGSVVDASGAVPVVVMPTPFYSGVIDLGRARDAGGAAVVDESGAAVADVFAFRVSLAQQTLGNAALQTFTDPPVADEVRAGADIVMPALPPGGATHTVFGQLVDAAGNVSNGFDVAVRVDDAPPGLIFTLNGGAPSSSTLVPFSVSAPAGAEVPVSVQISVDGGAPASFTLPLNGSERVNLGSVDGEHRVSARALDAVGNDTVSDVFIVLDRQGPRVDALRCTSSATCVDDGAAGTVIVTNDAAGRVDIAVTAFDTLLAVTDAQVRVGTGAPVTFPLDGAGGAVVPALQLPLNTTTTISVAAVDAVGNVGAPLVRTVTHDSGAPSVSALVLAGGASATRELVLPLHIDADSDVVEMRFSTSLTFTGQFAPFRADDFFTLAGADGSKQVCVQVRDGARNAGTRCSNITLDRAAPSLPAVNAVTILDGGDERITTTAGGVNVRLNWNTVGDVVAFKLGENSVDCANEPFETPAGIATVNTFTRNALPLSASPDGAKVVVACFRDAAGNVISAQDATVLDSERPVGSVLVNAGAQFTTDASENVSLQLRMATDTARAAVVETSAANGACLTSTVDCASATYVNLSGAVVNGDGVLVANQTVNLAGAPAPEGNKCFEVCFEDAAGNRSTAPALDGIAFDRTAPTVAAASVTLTGLDKAGASTVRTRTPFVTLAIAGGAAPADTAQMRISEDSTFAGGSQAFIPFSTSPQALTLSAGDATKNVFVQLRDNAGNVGAATQKSIALDTTPPTGAAIILASGASVTRLATVTAALQASGATEMRIATLDNDADGASEIFTGFAASANVTIEDNAAQDGLKTVLVVFRDDAGNESAAANDAIELDRVAPTADTLTCGAGSSTGVCINAGAGATNSVSASLGLAATGATEVQIAVDGCADSESFTPFSTSTSALLPTGDGTKTVAVRFRDAAGNVDQSFASCATTPGRTDTITLDTAAPSPVLSVQLQSAQASDSAGFTTTGSVRVTLAFSPGAGEETLVKHGEGSVDCSTSSGYIALGGTSPLVLGDGVPAGDNPIVLSAGDASKTYVACFKDDAGNVTSTTGQIVVDTARPSGSISINGGAAVTNVLGVNVNVTTSSADVNGVALVNDTAPGACNGSLTYVTPAAAVSHTLSAGGTSKTVFACFRDVAGNFSSAVVNDSINLDQAAPAVVIDARRAGSAAPGDGAGAGGARFTDARDVVVSVTSLAADATQIAVLSGTPTAPCANATFFPVPQAAPFNVGFTLDDVDTLQTIGVCAKDAAGNVATTTRQITLDRQPPQVALSINAGAAQTNNANVNVGMTATPSADPLRRVTSTDPNFNCAGAAFSGTFVAQSGTFALTLPAPDGTKSGVACFQDQAGNVVRSVDDIALDATAPSGVLALDGGAQFTLDVNTQAVFTGVSGDVTLSKLTAGATLDCADPAGYTGFNPSVAAPALSGADGTKTILACLKDGAGNFTQVSDSIALDQTNPSVAFAVRRAGGDAPDVTFTDTRSVVARVSAVAADTVAFAVAESSIDCGTASYTTLPQPLPTLPHDIAFTLANGSDGSRALAVCVKDAAGRTNGTTGTSSTINLDRAAPVVTALIEGGAAITADDDVSVSLVSTPAGDLLRATAPSTDIATDCTRAVFSGAFAALPASVSATLQNGAGFNDSGTKFLVGCFQDRAGNIAAATDDIFFDEDRPNFAGRPVCTGCNNVDATPSFALTFNDAHLGFTNAAALVDFSVPAGSGDVEFVLAMATTDGDQADGDLGDDRACTLDAQCNAPAGELCVDFPVDDTLAPAPPVVAKRCATTSPPDAVIAPLLGVQGKFEIVVALVDVAGNFSNAREIFVVRDTVAPGVSYALNSGAFTTQQTVFVRDLTVTGETHIAATSTLGSFLASSLVTFADVSPLEFNDVSAPFTLTDAIPVALSAGDGAKTVRVRFTDNAGNVAADVTADTVLDTSAPSDPRFTNGSVTITGAGTVGFPALLGSTDPGGATGSGLAEPKPYTLRGFGSFIGMPGILDCSSGAGGVIECNWDGTTAFNAPASVFAEGENRIRVSARDNAGNVSGDDLVTITKDSVAPGVPALTATSGTDFVTLSWVPADATHAGFRVFYKLQASGVCATSPATYTGTFAFEGASPITTANVTSFVLTGLPRGEGLCVGVAAVDAAGNASVLDAEQLFVMPLGITKVRDVTAAQLGLATGATPNGIGALAERNGFLYIAAAGKGLIELSIANPSCFTQALVADFQSCAGLITGGTVHTNPRDIAIAGHYAFVADIDGVDIVRIREGTAPAQLFSAVASLPLTDCRAVDVEGDILAAAHDGGLTLYDLSSLYAATPTAPPVVGTLARAGGEGFDVDIQGTLLALAYGPENGSASAQALINIANPAAPVNAAVQCEQVAAKTAAFAGRALVGREGDTGFVCDVGSGVSPRPVESAFTSNLVQRMVPVGPYVFGASSNQLQVLDFSNRADTVVVGKRQITNASGTSVQQNRGSVVVYGNQAFVAPFVTSGTPNLEVFQLGGDGDAFSSFGSDATLIGDRGFVQFDDAVVNGGQDIFHLGTEDVERDESLSTTGFLAPAEENGVIAIFQTTATTGFDLHERDETGFSAALIVDGATGQSAGNLVIRWPWLIYLRQNGANVELKTHRLDNNTAPGTLTLAAATLNTTARAQLALYNVHAYAALPGVGIVRANINQDTGALSAATLVENDGQVRGLVQHGRWLFFWTDPGTGVRPLKAQLLDAGGAWNSANVVIVDASGAQQNGPNFVNPPSFYGSLMMSPTPFGNGLSVERLGYAATTPFAPNSVTSLFSPLGQSGRGAWIAGDRLYMLYESKAIDIYEIR